MSLSANDPNGKKWFIYASDEVPTLSITDAPRPGLITDTIYESPIFFSTSRTIARELVVLEPGTWTLRERPIGWSNTEYVEMVTPAGASYVLGLNDDGSFYVEAFGTGARRLVTTVMHKGKMLWVADNRLPIPRP